MSSPGALAIARSLADEARLRIFSLLLDAEELCACEFETLLGLTQSNASRHLAKLKEAGLIEGEKRAQWVHFRIDRETLYRYPFAEQLVRSARDDLPILAADLTRSRAYRQSGSICAVVRDRADRQAIPRKERDG